MGKIYAHLSDEDLLRYADGELSSWRVARIRAHLMACWECRSRKSQFEAAIADVVRVHHQTLDCALPPAVGSRALLKARLAAAAAQPRPFWRPILRTFAHAATYAVAMALLVVGFGFAAHRFSLSSRNVAPTEVPVPNRTLTPGAARPLSVAQLCAVNYSDDTHLVPAALRERVFREYGIAGSQSSEYELDYLISPQLGGTPDIHNLWPEPAASGEWNMRAKDELEDRLHDLVCDGKIDLATAQRDLSTDWISAYQRYFHTDRPIAPM